jgi:hypothetical protein
VDEESLSRFNAYFLGGCYLRAIHCGTSSSGRSQSSIQVSSNRAGLQLERFLCGASMVAARRATSV